MPFGWLLLHKLDENLSRYCNRHQNDTNWGNISDLMTTLKMVLKTTIQKNLSKPQKFARKTSVAEFCCNQIIFLRFTVTLLMILKLMIWRHFILKINLRLWSVLNLSCTYSNVTIVKLISVIYFIIFVKAKFQKTKDWINL